MVRATFIDTTLLRKWMSSHFPLSTRTKGHFSPKRQAWRLLPILLTLKTLCIIIMIHNTLGKEKCQHYINYKSDVSIIMAISTFASSGNWVRFWAYQEVSLSCKGWFWCILLPNPKWKWFIKSHYLLMRIIFMTVFIREALIEENTSSEYIRQWSVL